MVSTPMARNLLCQRQLGMLQQALCGLDLWHVIVEMVGMFLISRIGAKIKLPALALHLPLLLWIPLYSFSMVLVDKHGMDKERYVSLVTPVALFNLIDTFPLRKEEMVLQAEMGQTCSTWWDGSSLGSSSSLSTSCSAHGKAWKVSLMYRFLFVIFKVYFIIRFLCT